MDLEELENDYFMLQMQDHWDSSDYRYADELRTKIRELKEKNMKEIRYTPKGYSYVECTANECYNWGGACICDECGEKMNNEIYLVFILHRAMCKKCFEEWQERCHKYEEDLYLQRQSQIAYYMAHGLDVKEEL